jgi:hypothetical protein
MISGVRRRRITVMGQNDAMAHYPVNHPMRPLYRMLALLAGVYLILFGIVGLITTSGAGLLDRPGTIVLGQGANLLWSILSLVIGVVAIIGTLVGRGVATQTQWLLGWALMVIGSYGLATSKTDANYLGFTIATVIVTYLVGWVLLLSSLYMRVGPPETTGAPRQVREGRTA